MSNEDKIDDIETLILMALETDNVESLLCPPHTQSLTEGIQPNSMYASDICDENRVDADSLSDLLYHPSETLGAESEVLWIDNTRYAAWMGFRQLPKKPKGLTYFGKASHFYEFNYRHVYTAGKRKEVRSIMVLDKLGKIIPTTMAVLHGSTLSDSKGLEHTHNILCRACGIIEDAHRSNAMLATVKDGKEIKFPVPLDDYKEVFSNRDAPLANGKKKAIVHWVAKHLRQTPTGKTTTVKKHVRGVKDIMVDGLTINIQPN